MPFVAGQKLHAADLTTGLLGPEAFIYQTTTQTGLGTGYFKVTVDTVDFDTNSIFDAVNHRLTPVQLGVYWVSVGVCFAPPSTANLTAAIYKNGNPTRRSQLIPSSVSGTTPSVSAPIEITLSTDYIEVYGQCSVTAGATRADTTYCSFLSMRFDRSLS